MRTLLLSAVFLAVQVVTGVHSIVPEQVAEGVCLDGSPADHLCACTVDHDPSPCPICTQLLSGTACCEDGAAPTLEAVAAPAAVPASDTLPATFDFRSARARAPPRLIG